jgi:hypothetical protein
VISKEEKINWNGIRGLSSLSPSRFGDLLLIADLKIITSK